MILKGVKTQVNSLIKNVRSVTTTHSAEALKVRDATNNDPWGPMATDMAEIAKMTHLHPKTCRQIMDALKERLGDRGKEWRQVLKALIVLNYCLHQGSNQVVEWTRENIHIIDNLREYDYVDKNGMDYGGNIRISADELARMVTDGSRLIADRAQRQKSETDSSNQKKIAVINVSNASEFFSMNNSAHFSENLRSQQGSDEATPCPKEHVLEPIPSSDLALDNPDPVKVDGNEKNHSGLNCNPPDSDHMENDMPSPCSRSSLTQQKSDFINDEAPPQLPEINAGSESNHGMEIENLGSKDLSIISVQRAGSESELEKRSSKIEEKATSIETSEIPSTTPSQSKIPQGETHEHSFTSETAVSEQHSYPEENSIRSPSPPPSEARDEVQLDNADEDTSSDDESPTNESSGEQDQNLSCVSAASGPLIRFRLEGVRSKYIPSNDNSSNCGRMRMYSIKAEIKELPDSELESPTLQSNLQ